MDSLTLLRSLDYETIFNINRKTAQAWFRDDLQLHSLNRITIGNFCRLHDCIAEDVIGKINPKFAHNKPTKG